MAEILPVHRRLAAAMIGAIDRQVDARAAERDAAEGDNAAAVVRRVTAEIKAVVRRVEKIETTLARLAPDEIKGSRP
jgi:hypothetical protein